MLKKLFFLATFMLTLTVIFSACSRRVGCPANGTNVGAERMFGGQKMPKMKKFRA